MAWQALNDGLLKMQLLTCVEEVLRASCVGKVLIRDELGCFKNRFSPLDVNVDV